MATELTLRALAGIPLIKAGDDLAGILLQVLAEMPPQAGDILLLAQKIVSKAEGRLIDLNGVEPGAKARELARECDKDPRLVELILSESTEVLRVRPGAIIVEHRLGFVCANACIDQSNVADGALLLPLDPDASCTALRDKLWAATGIDIPVIMVDSIGRAWRNGTIGTAIGVSGVEALADLRGRPDLFGRKLQTTEVGIADELAAAASMLMGQASEGYPAVLARGVPIEKREGTARELLRPRHMDLFR
jgi:coenzyme F420-0:L-glutamate ligase/coenzyme F420-1:gamma-L-glutamate ligase